MRRAARSVRYIARRNAPSFFGRRRDLLGGVLRHWKLVVGAVILMLAASYGALRLMPTLFQSDAEILVFDPESQIDDKVQTPISPFRSIADNAAMNTEIEVLKSESVALRVAKELELDRDPEFQPKSRIVAAAQRLANRPQPLPTSAPKISTVRPKCCSRGSRFNRFRFHTY
jgi:uncharacterized protein involved in exopolysaccharide biosynthesis